MHPQKSTTTQRPPIHTPLNNTHGGLTFEADKTIHITPHTTTHSKYIAPRHTHSILLKTQPAHNALASMPRRGHNCNTLGTPHHCIRHIRLRNHIRIRLHTARQPLGIQNISDNRSRIRASTHHNIHTHRPKSIHIRKDYSSCLLRNRNHRMDHTRILHRRHSATPGRSSSIHHCLSTQHSIPHSNSHKIQNSPPHHVGPILISHNRIRFHSLHKNIPSRCTDRMVGIRSILTHTPTLLLCKPSS
jgi:hypothetical protein